MMLNGPKFCRKSYFLAKRIVFPKIRYKNVQFQKISILPPQKGLEFPGGFGGPVRPKNIKKCMKLNWNSQRGEGGLRKDPFSGGGMDIFWNYTMCNISI